MKSVFEAENALKFYLTAHDGTEPTADVKGCKQDLKPLYNLLSPLQLLRLLNSFI